MRRVVLAVSLLGLFCVLAGQVFAISRSQLIIVADDGQFLGSFEDRYATNSIYNKYGKYGSKYETKSIFNKYSEYGSDYSSLSPFNNYASEAPWLMDRQGNHYGRLSTNRYAQGVTDYSYRLACELKGIRDSM